MLVEVLSGFGWQITTTPDYRGRQPQTPACSIKMCTLHNKAPKHAIPRKQPMPTANLCHRPEIYLVNTSTYAGEYSHLGLQHTCSCDVNTSLAATSVSARATSSATVRSRHCNPLPSCTLRTAALSRLAHEFSRLCMQYMLHKIQDHAAAVTMHLCTQHLLVNWDTNCRR